MAVAIDVRMNPCKKCADNIDNSSSLHKIQCPFHTSQACSSKLQQWLLNYCREQHPQSVVSNPCSLSRNTGTCNLTNFLVRDFGSDFVIQTRVCKTTMTIYHAVRRFGDGVNGDDYKFNITYGYEGGNLSLAGCVQNKEADSPVATKLNVLQALLGDIRSVNFNVTIYGPAGRSNQAPSGQPKKQSSVAPGDSKRAKTLEPTAVVKKAECKFHCGYEAEPLQCQKHETYYCENRKKCRICSEYSADMSTNSHYSQGHRDITHRVGATCTIIPVNKDGWLIFNCPFGTVLVRYVLFEHFCQLTICTPLTKEALRLYKAEFRVNHPDTKQLFGGTFKYHSYADDWFFNIPITQFNKYAENGKINITIDISKIENPQ